MSNVIPIKARQQNINFSADIYSFDRKKYRFQVNAASVTEAYYAFVAEAARHRVRVIRCIAIYFGLAEQREEHQVPAKVWQQYDQAVGSGLVEF